MSNRLNIPEDLASLIEKREQEDRRKNNSPSEQTATHEEARDERRSGKDRRADDTNS